MRLLGLSLGGQTDPSDLLKEVNSSQRHVKAMLRYLHTVRITLTGQTEDELQTLSSTAVSARFMVIKPLGQLLTTPLIDPDRPGKMAGPTFEIYRTGYALPHHDAAWIVLHERLLELAAYWSKLSGQQSAPQAD